MMKILKFTLTFFFVALFLVSCTTLRLTPQKQSEFTPSGICTTPGVDKPAVCTNNPGESPTQKPTFTITPVPILTQTDSQGEISIEITPGNLKTLGDTLVFDVSLNTHSIDLSMDLSLLSSLKTDSGAVLQANRWDAIKGGHHVSGKLIFLTTTGGKNILEGVKSFTISIIGLDGSDRQFTWQSNF